MKIITDILYLRRVEPPIVPGKIAVFRIIGILSSVLMVLHMGMFMIADSYAASYPTSINQDMATYNRLQFLMMAFWVDIALLVIAGIWDTIRPAMVGEFRLRR